MVAELEVGSIMGELWFGDGEYVGDDFKPDRPANTKTIGNHRRNGIAGIAEGDNGGIAAPCFPFI